MKMNRTNGRDRSLYALAAGAALLTLGTATPARAADAESVYASVEEAATTFSRCVEAVERGRDTRDGRESDCDLAVAHLRNALSRAATYQAEAWPARNPLVSLVAGEPSSEAGWFCCDSCWSDPDTGNGQCEGCSETSQQTTCAIGFKIFGEPN